MRRSVADRRVGSSSFPAISCVELNLQAPRNCICSMAWRFTKVSDNLTHWLTSAQAATEHILRMKKYELYLPLEPQALDLALRSALQRLCQGIPELLERVEVTSPVRICHQEQRRRVSRVILEPLNFLPEPLETGLSIVGTSYLCGKQPVSDVVASMAWGA